MTRVNAPASEVAFGETAEAEILKRWLKQTKLLAGVTRVVKSMPYDPYDILVLGKRGMPLGCVEIKKRRSPFSKYGDLMVPIKKHEFALELRERCLLPLVCVTEYGDGALVEVDLTQEPSERRDVKRHDRPGMTPVPHGLYKGSKLKVLARSAT